MGRSTSLSRNKGQFNRWRKRFLWHYIPLSLLSGVVVSVIVWRIQSPDRMYRLSVSTAYAALILLMLTLILGVLNVLRGRANPISTDMRRDTGIMATIVSVLHVVFGLQVHLSSPIYYFIVQPPFRDAGQLRRDMFGLANYTGLAATILVVFLLLLSNDFSLRKLGRDRWKMLQRTNYLLFALVIVHAVVYFIIEEPSVVYFVVFGLIVAATVGLQIIGFVVRIRQNNKERA